MKIKDVGSQAKHSETFPVYLVTIVVSRTTKKTRGGKSYFELILKDDSGTVSAKRFIDDESQFNPIERLYTENNIVDVSGMYNRKYKSITIETERFIGESEPTTVVESTVSVGAETFVVNIDELSTYLRDVMRSIGDQWLLSLLRSVFNDQTTRDQFFVCPAAYSNHHAYKGGLLHHIVGMLKMADTMVTIHPNNCIDIDLLKTGIILHDIGKIRVYKFENGRSMYIHPDKKIDHIKIGDIMLSGIMANIKGFPQERKQQIHRIIASHHGRIEWGAMFEPTSYEEVIISSLDVIDARFGRRGGKSDEQ